MIRKVQGSFVGSSNSNPVVDQVEMLQQKIDCLEIQNSELENEILQLFLSYDWDADWIVQGFDYEINLNVFKGFFSRVSEVFYS